MRATESTVEWLRSYYAAIDNLRFDLLEGFLHEDCSIQYPRGVLVIGRDRLIRQAHETLGTLARIHHELRHVWEEGEELIFELEVTYERSDGRRIVRPGAGVFVLEAGRIRQQRLFVDDSGVWD